jgi:iron complex outermembrane receptor protein
LLGGMIYYYENQDDNNKEVSGSSSAGYRIVPQIMQHDRHQGAVFLRAEHEFASRLQVSGGIRMVAVWETEEESEDYYEAVPQIQSLYRINENNSVYANIGRAFKVPAFGQMYIDRSNYAPNPELKPEYGWTYEAGWKWACQQVSGTISAFFMDFTDKLGTKYMEDLSKYQYHNMDSFQSSGVEWQLRYHFFKNFSLFLSGYFADPWEEIKGVREQAGSKFQLAPGIEYSDDKVMIGLNAEMYYDRERYLKDYTNIHLNASYAATRWLKLKLSIDNLLDDRDEVLYGNMTPTGNTQYVTYDPGIWVTAGVEMLF